MSTFINPPGPQPEPATYLDREALTAAALDLDKIPQELKDRPQWLCYRSNKIPVNPETGRPRSPVRVGG